jgi:hypothetical protein
MVEFIKKPNCLFCTLDNEILEVEPWGSDGIRVRATLAGNQTGLDKRSSSEGGQSGSD